MYIPHPVFSVTETVCIVMHMPPNPRNAAARIKRSPSHWIAERLVQPTVNSAMPKITTRIGVGNIHRNQRLKKARITRKTMIHPQTFAIVFTDLVSASGTVTFFCWLRTVPQLLPPGSSIPTASAEKMWINQRSHGEDRWEKTDATIPNRKDGPALLQNPSILRASCFLSCPLAKQSATAWAPAGYPPRRPIKNMDSLPCGMRQSLLIGESSLLCMPEIDPVSRMDSIKKGRREGITVMRQRVIPSWAPAMAVFVSRIIKSIPIDAKRPVLILFFNSDHLRRIYAAKGNIIPPATYAFTKRRLCNGPKDKLYGTVDAGGGPAGRTTPGTSAD